MSRPRHGYPLGALFLLVAACAVLTAIVAPVGRAVAADKVTLVELLVSLGIGVLSGLVLGLCVGAFHYRLFRGLWIGALTGGLLGLVAGPLAVVPAASVLEVFTAAAGGSVLLVVVAIALRLSSGKG